MCQNIFHRHLKYKRCGARETDDDYQINTVKKTERCGPCCMRDGRMYVCTYGQTPEVKRTELSSLLFY